MAREYARVQTLAATACLNCANPSSARATSLLAIALRKASRPGHSTGWATEAAQAKVFATRMAGRHIAALMHAMGAEGLRDVHPFLRHLAAAQVATLVDGSTEMLLERVARSLPRS